MTRPWDKEHIWVLERNRTHELPNTSRKPGALYPLNYENSWRARSFNWVHLWEASTIATKTITRWQHQPTSITTIKNDCTSSPWSKKRAGDERSLIEKRRGRPFLFSRRPRSSVVCFFDWRPHWPRTWTNRLWNFEIVNKQWTKLPYATASYKVTVLPNELPMIEGEMFNCSLDRSPTV